jgi:hypothetical protein
MNVPIVTQLVTQLASERRGTTRRCRGFELPVIRRPRGRLEQKEIAMTRRIRLWITAVLTVAATAVMVGLTITAQAGVTHTHPNPSLAGITFNAPD